jgi:multidrug resistance protein
MPLTNKLTSYSALFWAPFSEMFGRQIVYILTYAAFTAFNAGVAGSQNIQTVIILRFFAGSFGSSPLTNAGGVIADCFPARQRGLAMSIFAAAPFLGPALGPVIGGFLGQYAGWRWVMGFMAAFSGLALFVGVTLVPETYAPVLLRKRAERLSKITGKVYRSRVDIDRGEQTLGESMKIALTRPWILLIKEPIVLLLSTYMAIVYGTLYLLFGAFPIVYQETRGWSEGIGGLAFIGVLIGMMIAVLFSIFVINPRYQKVVDNSGGVAPPEARLPAAMLGGALLPIGLFWFAWTNGPGIHWAVSMAAGIPFGCGMVLVFLSIMVCCLYVSLTITILLTALFPELPDRLIHNFRRLCHGSKRRPAKQFWCCISSFHHLYVRCTGNSLGIVHPSVPSASLRTISIPLLQIRRYYSCSLQVRRRSRSLHGTLEERKSRPST